MSTVTYKKKRISVPSPRKDPSTYTYDELYKEYWPALQKLFMYSIGDYHTAEDLAQLVMIRVWRYWDRLQWDKLAGAIGVIANNVRYDYLKANFDRPDKEFYEDELEFDCHDNGISDPIRKLVVERAADAVVDFTEILKDKDREFFLDFYIHDIDLNDLCEKHSIKRPHVYVRLHRIRELLFECFEAYDLLPDGEWNRGTPT